MLIPSLKEAHRTKGKESLSDYLQNFAKNSGLNKQNLILLSGNLKLNLDKGGKIDKRDYQATKTFEEFVYSLK